MEDKFSNNEEFVAEMERRRQEHQSTEPVEETPQYNANPSGTRPRSDKGGLVGFLVNHGIAHSEEQANYILVGVLVAVLAFTAWVIWH